MHVRTEQTAPSNHVRRLHSLLALPYRSAHAQTTRLPRKRRHPINICEVPTVPYKQCVYPVCTHTTTSASINPLATFSSPRRRLPVHVQQPRSTKPALHPPRLGISARSRDGAILRSELRLRLPCYPLARRVNSKPNSSTSWHASQIDSPLVPPSSSEGWPHTNFPCLGRSASCSPR